MEQTIFRQALDMDSSKMELPQSWEGVRQNLLNLRNGAEPEQNRQYYIDRQTFHSLCDQYAVPADDGLRAWLLTWLNDLGVCFSYHLGENGQERSTDYKILDPMWLTSAVYKIIWEKEQTDDGLITLSEIHRILERPGSAAMKKDGIPCLENVAYNEQECGYVLDIMRMFRISYPADARTDIQGNTDAVEGNTKTVWENIWTLQQSNLLLGAIRDGKVQLPLEVMEALTQALQQSDKPALKTAGQKMKWKSWKGKGQLLRDFLGDAANLATVTPVLVKLGTDYGPTLLKLLAELNPV